MKCFFTDQRNITPKELKVVGEEFHHLRNVCRLKPPDKIIVYDNTGWEYHVTLKKLSSSSAIGEIEARVFSQTEPKSKITLAQAVPKAKKLELIIQKSTELGVSRIIPLDTARTVVHFNKEKASIRHHRWQEIAKSASKQARRAIIPEITPISSLAEVNLNDYDLSLILWEEEKQHYLKEVLRKHSKFTQRIIVFIGPEGGFTPAEVELLKEKGATPVSLGKRILRSETAGFIAIALILYELGELG
jgi:16S rRNA (uracil1498-N3)-methyltransferase